MEASGRGNYLSIGQTDDHDEILNPLENQTQSRREIRSHNNLNVDYSNKNFISSRCFTMIMILYSILLLSVVSFVTIFYNQMKTDEEILDKRFTVLMTKFNDLQQEIEGTKYEQQQNNVKLNAVLNSTIERLNLLNQSTSDTFCIISDRLTELANHSNLEVLDKLQVTELQINENLGNVKNHVNNQLSSISNNVTIMLNKSSSSMKLVQDQIHLKLNSTLLQMKVIGNIAYKKIENVQKNVTSQLAQMDRALFTTKEYLNISVKQAQFQIQNDVRSVKDNIEQYVAITNKQFAAENDFVKYQLAGTFTLLGCLISLWHLTSHIRHYTKPDIQRRVMAVLWMVPIYSVTSWLSLVVPNAEYILSGLRDGYEAYVVYTFIALLVAILQDGDSHGEFIDKLTQHIIEENQKYNDAVRKKLPLPEKHLVPPCPCCYNNARVTSIAVAFLNQCKLMGMQFVIMKPTLAALPFLIQLSGYDYEGQNPFTDDRHVNWNSAKLYIILIQNISVAIAFYGLLNLYHGVEKELRIYDPWPKFLCIKGVVFMTFWQGIAIEFMSSMGFLDIKAANQIQNLLICIEMFIASIAHFYIFPYQEWQEGYEKRQKNIGMNETLAVGDFITDFKNVVSKWETPATSIHPSMANIDNTCDLEYLNQQSVNLNHNSHNRYENAMKLFPPSSSSTYTLSSFKTKTITESNEKEENDMDVWRESEQKHHATSSSSSSSSLLLISNVTIGNNNGQAYYQLGQDSVEGFINNEARFDGEIQSTNDGSSHAHEKKQPTMTTYNDRESISL